MQKFKGTPGQIRRQRVERIGAISISLVLAAWILVNLLESPQQFAQVAILGLRNGLLYALIALGYTLVYGIIELINFAHGDLFMLSAVFSSYFITVWFKQDESNPAGLAYLHLLSLCRYGIWRRDQCLDRTTCLPSAKECA